ncbi:MAG: tripartite tricarboxylate transporter permease [Methanothermobacter sp.]|nr:tripartite tricarboxylate transporter permease [Methanothermobacter sp.]
MMGIIEILFACLLGVITGALTGLIPGIHVNTVGAFIFAASGQILGFLPEEVLAVFLLSLSVTHALLEFIPSTLLGVPDEATALSVLPGHRMVLEGRAGEAIRAATVGGVGGILLTIILLPFLLLALPPLYGFIRPHIWLILILVSGYMMLKLSRNFETLLWAVILFLFSGAMGWIIFQAPISPGLGLMTLFTGFFGLSTIAYSFSSGSYLPEQEIEPFTEFDGGTARSVLAGGLASVLLGFLPGFGPAQGGMIACSLTGSGGEDSPGDFITALSCLNTSDALFSLLTLYIIGNPRSGIAVYISQIMQDIDAGHIFLFISASLLAVSLAAVISIRAADYLCTNLSGINYRKISLLVMLFMTASIFIFAAMEGASIPFIALALITSTSFGLIPHCTGTSKSHLMGVLVIPAVAVYMGI